MMATSLLSDLNQWNKTRMASEPSKSFTSHKPAPNLLRHSRTRHRRRRIIGLVMDFLSRKTLNSFLVPGAFIVLGAVLLLDTKWIALSQSEVTFFYYATFVAGGLLAWRFHSNRIVFSVIVLLLGHHAIEWFAQRGDRKSTRLNSSHQIISYA